MLKQICQVFVSITVCLIVGRLLGGVTDWANCITGYKCKVSTELMREAIHKADSDDTQDKASGKETSWMTITANKKNYIEYYQSKGNNATDSLAAADAYITKRLSVQDGENLTDEEVIQRVHKNIDFRNDTSDW
jgi:hypothetical protein